MLSPSERRLRARAAAFALHATGGTNTGPALAARMAKYEREVDPDGTLSPDARAKRAHQALRRDMALLSLKASRAKTRKASEPSSGQS